MNIFDSIKKSRINNKVVIFILWCFCFCLGLCFLINRIRYYVAIDNADILSLRQYSYFYGQSGQKVYYETELVRWILNIICDSFSMISIIVFGVYLVFCFGNKKFAILPLIAIGLHCIADIIWISVRIPYISVPEIIFDFIVVILGYFLLIYSCVGGFNNKLFLMCFVGVILISLLLSNLIGYYDLTADFFVILLFVFGLTNEVCPIRSKRRQKYLDITSELNNLKTKYELGLITEQEYKDLKKSIIEKL